MSGPLLVGTDTQSYEFSGILTGIQRVSCDAHVGLTDRLSSAGMQLVPFHTRIAAAPPAGTRHPYVEQDPVLQFPPVPIENIDIFLLLDVNLKADYSRLFRSIRQRPRPVIAIVHDIIPLLDASKFEPAMKLEFRSYLQQILHIADHLVVTSHKVRDDLERLGWVTRGTVHVMPLGSSFRRSDPVTPLDERMSVIYVSTIEPRKGHRELLEAFDLLLRDGVDIDLTLVGRSGWAPPELMDAICGHEEFGGRLRWRDSPDDVTLLTEIRRCSIGVFPSVEEGFGLFVEEGLSRGLKMVVRDIPTFRERAQDNLSYHGPTPGEIASALLAAHRRPWLPPSRPVRTMADFHDELADLIFEVADRDMIGPSLTGV